MSVLISDINKPTNCKECIFCVNDWCVINSRLHHIKGAEETTQYCPLVELPPHGDLIDRDALTTVTEMVNGEWKTYLEVFEITDAPTIIEAEGKDG